MDKTEQLILEVQKNPIIYDKNHKDYKDIVKKRDFFTDIGNRVGLTGRCKSIP